METKNKILTKSQLEDLIPDVIFGKAGDEDISAFYTSIHDHPELEAEYLSMKDAFSSVHINAIENHIDRRSRNLSVMVNQRLNSPRNKVLYLWKYLAPAAAIAIIGYFALTVDFTQSGKESKQLQQKIAVKTQVENSSSAFVADTKRDAPAVKTDITKKSNRKFSSENLMQTTVVDAALLDDFIHERLLDNVNDYKDLNNMFDDLPRVQILGTDYDLNDIYFESIIEELDNEEV